MNSEGKGVKGHRRLIPDGSLFPSFNFFLGGGVICFSPFEAEDHRVESGMTPGSGGRFYSVIPRGWRKAEVTGDL